jgi:ABC-type Fe3+-hydroxamate transport system substrate-binding protein
VIRLVLALALTLASSSGAAAPRIVTLVPSLGDDAFAIGANVVGVSRFTNVPAKMRVPAIGDFQGVDAEAILRLHPAVVIGIPSQERLVQPLRSAGVRVLLVADDSYDDIFLDLKTVGKISHRQARAAALARDLRQQTAALRKRVTWKNRPSVFFALGTGPIWAAGPHSYIDALIALAGGRNAASSLTEPWGEFSEEALLRAQPDAIVAGRDSGLRAVLSREPWRSLRAVREGHVFIVTDARVDNALYRPGPDYNEGLRWLIERLSSLSTSTTHPAR